MTRKEKLDRLFDLAPPVGATLDFPNDPPRFVGLEQDENGDTLWAYFGNNLNSLAAAIARSQTDFAKDVRIHDLDRDEVLVPVWKVERFAKLEDNFSYTEGYATIP